MMIPTMPNGLARDPVMRVLERRRGAEKPATSAHTIGGGAVGGEVVIFRVFRDVSGGNILSDDARLLAIKIIYTVDSHSDA